MTIPTHTLADAQRFLDAERRAEWGALTALRGATFTDCLKFNGLPLTREVSTAQGTSLTVWGSDLYDQRTWQTFLSSRGQREPLVQLIGLGAQLAAQYQAWVCGERTPYAHLLIGESDLAWFKRVITLAVTRHIMEQKYASYTTHGLPTFADPGVAITVEYRLTLNSWLKEVPALVHREVKEETQARQLLEAIDALAERIYKKQERPIPTGPSLIPARAKSLTEGEQADSSGVREEPEGESTHE